MALALALAGGASPALAQSKGLSCMASSYSAEQSARLDALGPEVRFGDGGQTNAAAEETGSIAMAVVQACIQRLGWTQEEAMYAAFYELGRVNEDAFRRSGQLSREQLSRLDAALATGDRTRLWAAVERGLVGGMLDDGSDPAPTDAIAMGAFILGAGFDMDDDAAAEKIGILLGFMGLQRLGEREFSALQ